ncbi:MAG: AAA family ATPase, partial [Ostreibacterium sp.]
MKPDTNFIGGFRYLSIIYSNNLADALAFIKNNYPNIIAPIVIDATKDLNQNKWLGQEIAHTLLHINPETRINALLSILGCIKGGAFLFLSIESGNYGYFKDKILFPSLKMIEEKQPSPPHIFLNKFLSDAPEILNFSDELTKKLSKAKQQGIVHLIGERGTGKSTQLGLFIRQQIYQNKKRVILTSPSKKSSLNTLKQLQGVSRETFQFLSPETLMNITIKSDIVVVDEASSMDNALLEKLRQQANKKQIIFATTIDGYESTGQSYRLKQVNANEDSVICLQEPRRFSITDPIHQLTQKLCHPTISYDMVECLLANGIYVFNQQELAEKSLTMPCYTLLQQAHYRSTPN